MELTYDTIMGYVPSSNETLYTVWEKGYVITFDPNGGHIDQLEEGKPYTATIKKGDPLPYEPYISIDDDHKVLDGWAFNKDDENYLKYDYYGYIPESDLTLYAVWKDCYFVTFDPGDGYFPWLGEDKCEVYKVAQGDPLDTSFTPQNDDPDVAIAGWSHTANGKAEIGRYNLFEYVPVKSETLYAVYEKSVFQFTDVQDKKLSYYKAVLWALENNITTGTDATHFSPSKACTRAQVATFLWRANGKPAPTIKNNPFTDVPAGRSFSDAVLWAYELGITTGTSKTEFSPSKTCTRAQTVTFLYRNFLYQ